MINETLTVALLIQIKDDYDSLMKTVGLHERITPKNYKQCGKWATFDLLHSVDLFNLQQQLLAKYTHYMDQLPERNYISGQEAS